MGKILKKDFFERRVLEVAPDLLGKYLVAKSEGQTLKKFMITEVEAYDGVKDLACHASKGKTKRTKIMFGQAGVFYVYLVYGMYFMLNVVTDKKDYPSAVLIRGIENFKGPGKLTKALGIDKSLNGKEASISSGFWFEDNGNFLLPGKIKKTPRIGVDYAGPVWSEKPYRFLIE